MHDDRLRADCATNARATQHGEAVRVATDLDAIADLALDPMVSRHLAGARRAALARLQDARAPSGHWVNWSPAGLALALVVFTAWGLLVNSADNGDADLLADSLPFDAYLDAGFESSIGINDVELVKN